MPADERLSEEEIAEGLSACAEYAAAIAAELTAHTRVDVDAPIYFLPRFRKAARTLLPLALRSLAAERARRPDCGHRVIADDNGYGACAMCSLLALAQSADAEGRRADALARANAELRAAIEWALPLIRYRGGPPLPHGEGCGCDFCKGYDRLRAAHAAATEQGAGGGE